MKQYRVMLGSMLAILTLLFIVGPCLATDQKATREECIVKTKEAIKMIKEKGIEATLEKLNDRQGPFVWKDTYVFCFEEDSFKMTGNAFVGRMREYSMKGYMDVNGKLVFQEFVKMINDKGQGWVDYMHRRRQDEEPRKKISFVMKAPDTNLIVGAGIYE